MSRAISKSILYFKTLNSQKIKIIVAKLKNNNIMSKRYFMKSGFKLSPTEGNNEIDNFICK